MRNIKELLNDATVLRVDVRSPWEFDSEHLPGALNIPLEEVMENADKLRNEGRDILLYCRSGNRSAMAAGLLQQQGLGNVYNGGSIDDLKSFLN